MLSKDTSLRGRQDRGSDGNTIPSCARDACWSLEIPGAKKDRASSNRLFFKRLSDRAEPRRPLKSVASPMPHSLGVKLV